MSIYLVIFGKPRYLGFLEMLEKNPEKGSYMLVESLRGVELGLVAGVLTQEQQARFQASCIEEPQEGQPRGGEPMLQNVTFVALPGKENMEEHKKNQEEEQRILLKAREILRSHDLSMKLVDVEYMLDRKKLFFYFTSDQRVDFRAYVRDLAREFKTRIELRQIGVRDEAKAVKGIGPCGQVCCCSYWLHSFTPICIKMVKEQNLALNPTKISGICGRLMCCMSYEHPMYQDLWSSLPNPGTKLKTPKGNYILIGVDLDKSAVRVRCPEGPEVLVAVNDFREFRESIMKGLVWDKMLNEDVKPPQMEEIFDFDTLKVSTATENKDKKSRGTTRKPYSKDSRKGPVKLEKDQVPGEGDGTDQKRPVKTQPKRRKRKKKSKSDQSQPKTNIENEGPSPSSKEKPPRKKKNNSRRNRLTRSNTPGKLEQKDQEKEK